MKEEVILTIFPEYSGNQASGRKTFDFAVQRK